MEKILFDKDRNKIINQNLHEYQIPGGLKFDGVNDYIQLPNPTLTLFQNNIQFDKNWSFNVIMNITNSGFQGVFMVANNSSFDSSTKGFFCYKANGFIVFFIARNNVYSGSGNIPNNKLGVVNFTFTYEYLVGSKAYIDGVLVQTGIYLPMLEIDYLTGISPRIGNYLFASNYYLKDDLYDIKIFDKALNQTEITHLFESKGQSIPAPASNNVIANYPFRDAQGFTLSDISGNSNNGTLINYTLADVTPSINNKWLGTDGLPYNP